MTKIELFEKCTGVKLPWHITNAMITVLTMKGILMVTFDNHIELIYEKPSIMVYLDSPVFKMMKSYNGNLSFVFGVLEEHREMFKEWHI